MMKIQQHDGVVVDAAVIAAGLRRASARGKGVAGEREAPRLGVRLPSLLPPLYRPPGGRRPWRWDLPGPTPPPGAYIKEGKGVGRRTLCLGASLPLLHLFLLPQ